MTTQVADALPLPTRSGGGSHPGPGRGHAACGPSAQRLRRPPPVGTGLRTARVLRPQSRGHSSLTGRSVSRSREETLGIPQHPGHPTSGRAQTAVKSRQGPTPKESTGSPRGLSSRSESSPESTSVALLHALRSCQRHAWARATLAWTRHGVPPDACKEECRKEAWCKRTRRALVSTLVGPSREARSGGLGPS